MGYQQSVEITVSDTWKVTVDMEIEEKEVLDWSFKDSSGIDISEDIDGLYKKNKAGKEISLGQYLLERACEEVFND